MISGEGGRKYLFSVSNLEEKYANEKKNLIYELKSTENEVIAFDVQYSKNGSVTKIEEIIKECKKSKIILKEEEIKRAFSAFEKQSNIDFFINKNVKKFLSEQLDMWIYQYMFKQSAHFDIARFNQIQDFKNIANKIINFISQFENELVKIWNKPRFVLNSNIVVTIDKLKDKGFDIAKLRNHKNFKNQQKEWTDLGIAENNELLENDFLPIDTKFFSEFKDEIEELFNENEFDGLLIKSENYQALNTILPRFKNKIDLIYIDPPYNAPSSEIIYINNFKDSTWLSMMENRLSLAKELMSNLGLINIAIDDIEIYNLGKLCEEIFGKENYLSTISVLCNPVGRVANNISKKSEFNILYAKSNKGLSIDVYKEDSKNKNTPLLRSGMNSKRTERPYRFFPILEKNNKLFMITDDEYRRIYDKEISNFNDDFLLELKNKYEKNNFNFILPINANGEKLVWQRQFQRIKDEIKTYDFKNNKIYTPYLEKEKLSTLWQSNLYSNPKYGVELLGNILGSSSSENTPKSLHTVKKFIEMISDDGNIVLDFFAGSGTTAHAVIEYNRVFNDNKKFILIEENDYFYTKLIPRIKKIAFSKDWKNGKLKDNKQINPIPIIFKYYELEQYEQILRTTSYTDIPHDYLESKKAGEINDCFLFDEKLSQAIKSKEDSFEVDLSKLYPNIDLKETIYNLTGKKPLKITHDKVIFEDREFNLLEILKRLLVW